MRFKVGDRVRIKSLDWYNENKDEDDIVICGEFNFIVPMTKFCSKVLTIHEDVADGYIMSEDKDGYVWTDEMIEGLAEEEVGLVDELSSRWVNEFNLPEGYIFKDENGNVINAHKIVLEKKKKEYPKTFLECCDVLNVGNLIERGVKGYKAELFDTLQKLYICRDAYWKIAGEEMGLNRPWGPNKDDIIFGISRIGGLIERFDDVLGNSHILEFPTEEIRDAFYENFKELIEQCKELL